MIVAEQRMVVVVGPVCTIIIYWFLRPSCTMNTELTQVFCKHPNTYYACHMVLDHGIYVLYDPDLNHLEQWRSSVRNPLILK